MMKSLDWSLIHTIILQFMDIMGPTVDSVAVSHLLMGGQHPSCEASPVPTGLPPSDLQKRQLSSARSHKTWGILGHFK